MLLRRINGVTVHGWSYAEVVSCLKSRPCRMEFAARAAKGADHTVPMERRGDTRRGQFLGGSSEDHTKQVGFVVSHSL
jgi:hypothetical protein